MKNARNSSGRTLSLMAAVLGALKIAGATVSAQTPTPELTTVHAPPSGPKELRVSPARAFRRERVKVAALSPEQKLIMLKLANVPQPPPPDVSLDVRTPYNDALDASIVLYHGDVDSEANQYTIKSTQYTWSSDLHGNQVDLGSTEPFSELYVSWFAEASKRYLLDCSMVSRAGTKVQADVQRVSMLGEPALSESQKAVSTFPSPVHVTAVLEPLSIGALVHYLIGVGTNTTDYGNRAIVDVNSCEITSVVAGH